SKLCVRKGHVKFLRLTVIELLHNWQAWPHRTPTIEHTAGVKPKRLDRSGQEGQSRAPVSIARANPHKKK
ncbi:MAG: hypothetical protein OEV38_07145, partial [Nitrospira sp.]|nr:hypothetical protein [Nitrospira sp.]